MERPLILNRYRPLETRGTGGFSVVEVAWDTRIQRRVAIKRIPLPLDAKGAANIPPGLAEARTAAMLSHPSIVHVLDFESDSDEAFLIMEYIDGPTLASFIESQNGLISLDETAAIVSSVAKALEFAHENQVLHLDIKPENILIDRTGRAKVTDFGLADLAGIMGFSDARGGTIGYMPPEQMLGEDVDQRTDEWALASLIYEMLTGENPFWAPSLERSLARVDGEDVLPPSSIREDLDPRIDEILLDALHSERDIRFPTIADFIDELLPLLGDPDEGRNSIREAIEGELEDDWVTDEEAIEKIGIWDRMGQRFRSGLGRLVAGVLCGLLTWLAIGSLGLGTFGTIGVLALIVLAALIAPQLGAALAAIAFSVGIIMSGSWLVGGASLVVGLIWWLLSGHRGVSESNVPLATPVLGLLHLTPALPLIAGYCLPWKKAAVATFFGGILITFMAAATGSDSLLFVNTGFASNSGAASIEQGFIALLADPTTAITIAGWVIASIVMSSFCSRASKAFSVWGSVLGALIMICFQMMSQRVAAGGTWSAPSFETSLAIGLSFILLCTVAFFGAPYRSEEDDDEE